MDIEAALLTSILKSGGMEEAIDLRLGPQFFEAHREVWNYMVSTFRDHKSLPPVEVLESRFDFSSVSVETSVSYLAGELKKKWLQNTLTDGIKVQAKLLDSMDPESALREIRDVISRVDQRYIPSRDVDIAENPLSRIDRYHEKMASDGFMGIPTPWPYLNDMTMGFRPEQLIMIVGRKKTGKTWAEVVLAIYQWLQGFKPLILSREMSVEEFIERLDAAYAKISASRLRSGKLTTEEVDRWRDALHKMGNSESSCIVSGDDEGSLGISGVAAKIQRYRPDILYVDGGYLIQDERGGKAEWSRWANVCWDLKLLARRERVPIVITHQFSKDGIVDGTSDNLKYGDVAMWFDLILGLYRGDDLKLNREMLVKILDQRGGPTGSFVCGWDLDSMSFDEKASGVDDIGAPEAPKDIDQPVDF